jgi:hypothetical protein
MAKITKSELKQIISEEVARAKKIKELQEKKKVLQEAIKKMEEGEDLDEISWGGVKSALGFAGKKAGEAVGSVTQKASSALDKAQTKLKTGLATLDKGVKDFGAELSAAATKGDIQDLNDKINNVLANIVKMGEELNKKEVKLGLPPTKMKSRLMSAANKLKTVSPSSQPVMAENLTINESIKEGETPMGKELSIKLNTIIGKMNRPDFESEARALAGQLVSLVDKDQKF